MRRFHLASRMFVIACSASALGAGCAREPSHPVRGGQAVVDTLSWHAVDGAVRYRVRGWAGEHLLFEVASSDTQLVLSPALRRATAAFDTAGAEIGAVDSQGDLVRRQWRELRRSSRAGDGGAGGGT